MPRLPIPGSDNDNWATLLNEFLSVEHAADGTHKQRRFLVAASDAPVNIKALAHYTCNGTNDQVEINQALTNLGSLGGIVALSAGTFYCAAAIAMPRRCSLVGTGRATILRAVGTWTAYDGLAQGAVIEPLNNGIDKTFIGSLAIHGNRYQSADVHGIYYNITSKTDFDEGPDAGHIFSDIYINATRRHGIFFNGSHMRANKVNRVRIFNVGEEGVTVAHGYNIDCPDSSFHQCESGSSSGAGFYINGTNNRFTNCKSWYSDLSGYEIRKPRCQFAACEAQDNEQHGFYITSGPTSLVGCHADSNSWNSESPTSSYDGFHIPFGNYVQIVGCSAYDKNEGGRGYWQRYGFYIQSTSAEHNQIIGVARDNASGGLGGNGATVANSYFQITGQA